MTDRGSWLACTGVPLNVRRLMYQSLIWPLVAGDDPRSLRAALYSKDSEGLPNSLIDCVRRDMKLGRDFLGAEVLIDKAQAIELTGRQACDALRHQRRPNPFGRLRRRIARSV